MKKKLYIGKHFVQKKYVHYFFEQENIIFRPIV